MINEIIANKTKEIDLLKKSKPLATVRLIAEQMEKKFDIGEALLSFKNKPSHLVVEFNNVYDILNDALDYEKKGFSAISIMTDKGFLANEQNMIRQLSDNLSIPIIRNDYIIDEYQIYETKVMQADSFILRPEILDLPMLQYLLEVGRDLFLQGIILANNLQELLLALKTDAKLIMFNFRDTEIQTNNLQTINQIIKKEQKKRIFLCLTSLKKLEQLAAIGLKNFVLTAEIK